MNPQVLPLIHCRVLNLDTGEAETKQEYPLLLVILAEAVSKDLAIAQVAALRIHGH